ncbi:hypothetical protein [Actinoplanes auranticolor]|uniref:ABC-2 type transport system permease protein n=1 Tax=Actinoplanes auranticolor TaxID=47988 RepID=A0A919VIE9_9ACTN|nr:hypothetical protein [Actinoplanes auranticolor]GIM63751.1 hypothetical protein Aau02nite_06050 [Actinoplanes auranticolor]
MTGAAPIGFGDLLAAELIKIRTLPAIRIALAGTLLANGVLGILAATDAVRVAGPDGPVPITRLGGPLLAPVYVFVAIAVFAAGSEFRGGQVRVSLLAVPRRARLFAAKSTVCALVSVLAAVLVAVPFPHAATGTAFPALVTAYLLLALVGYGFAVIARTVVIPLAVLSAAALLVAPMLRGVLPDLVRYLPHDAALSLAGLPGGPEALGRAGGLLVLLSWAAACVAAAGLVFVRRDA